MIFLGLGELTGGIFIGKIRDNFGQKCATLVVLIISMMSAFFTLSQILSNQTTELTFIMTFLWGIYDCTINVHVNSILGF